MNINTIKLAIKFLKRTPTHHILDEKGIPRVTEYLELSINHSFQP